MAAGTGDDEPRVGVVPEEIRLGFLKTQHQVVQAVVEDAIRPVKRLVLRLARTLGRTQRQLRLRGDSSKSAMS